MDSSPLFFFNGQITPELLVLEGWSQTGSISREPGTIRWQRTRYYSSLQIFLQLSRKGENRHIWRG